MQILSRSGLVSAKLLRLAQRQSSVLMTRSLKAARMVSSKFHDQENPVAPFISSLGGPANLEQDKQEESFFRYTSGRWLFREDEQMAKRYVRFNVLALQQTAAEAMKSPCVSISKLPEGLFNKVFLLKMGEGQEVIAKLPNPNAGVKHLTVASEVATLDFLRNVVKIPVPEVYAWNSSLGQSNPVGAEYIIMEKIPGYSLEKIWPELSNSDQISLVKSVVQVEAKLISTNFTKYGSLYYVGDEAKHGFSSVADEKVLQPAIEGSPRFVIGRSIERDFWAEERNKLDIDRGPWTSAEEYFRAVAKREIAWITSCAKRNTKNESSTSKFHIELLQKFLLVLPHIIPTQKDLLLPKLWHTDLHRGNIFVDSARVSEISGIIDWQGVALAPFFRQARFASAFDSDWDYPWGAVMPPPLRADIDVLSEDERQSAQLQYTEVKLKKFYEVASRKLNAPLFQALDAMQIEDNYLIPAIFDLVGRSWIDGPIPLRHLLMQVFQSWSSLIGSKKVTCPISFSQTDIVKTEQEMEKWANAYNEFHMLRSSLVGKDGWVPHEEYQDAKVRLEKHKGLLKELQAKLKDAGGTDAENVV